MRRRQQPEATPEEEEHDEDEYETDDGEGEGEDGESEYEPVDANEAAAETEEDDEEEEEEEEEEDEESFQPWMGIRLLPEREAVLEALAHYKDSGRKQLTVLLIGKSGMGKSSTCNSVLNESAARVSAFKLQADTETTTPLARTLMGLPEGSPDVEGLRVKFIDTCGLEDPEAGDTINYGGLERMAEDLNGQSIDAVLYVDRLDMYRVEPLDRRIFDSITNMFGRDIWRKTIIALTHGNMRQPPPGTTYDDFVTRRVQLLRRAMRRPFGRAPLPYVLIENSESCPQDITRCRVLPDGPWIVNVVEELVDMALRGRPYVYRPHMTSRPNKRYQWLLPLIVYGQYFVFRQYLEPRIKRDMELQDKHDDDVWKEKAKERKRLGIGPPLMPSKETKWRLEQMYDDD